MPIETAKLGSRIALTTVFDSQMNDIAKISVPNFRKYARRHGYDCRVYDSALDPTRLTKWSKYIAMLSAMHYEWVCWADCDALFMNMSLSVEDMLSEALAKKPGAKMIFGADFNGLNSGLILAKGDEWTRQCLQTILFCRDLILESPDGFGPKEQNTIKTLMRTFRNIEEGTLIHSRKQFHQLYGAFQFEPGDYFLHFAAMSQRDRQNAMRRMTSQVVV